MCWNVHSSLYSLLFLNFITYPSSLSRSSSSLNLKFRLASPYLRDLLLTAASQLSFVYVVADETERRSNESWAAPLNVFIHLSTLIVAALRPESRADGEQWLRLIVENNQDSNLDDSSRNWVDVTGEKHRSFHHHQWYHLKTKRRVRLIYSLGGAQAKPVTDVCLGCICEAISGCNRTLTCNGDVCGLFRITWAYWSDSGKPTLPNEQISSETGKSRQRKRTPNKIH